MPAVIRHRERGVVLLVVLFFALLLTSSIATFMRRATVDALIARNREAAANAEALARGGVRLATALLIQDRLEEKSSGAPIDAHQDGWFRAGDVEIPAAGGATLRVRIEDSGARFNLNALFNALDGTVLGPQTEAFLVVLLEKVIEEMAIPPGEKVYDPWELAFNLIDYVDADDVRTRGGLEDDYYQEQDPPYRAANRPLLSVEELRLVEGFDGQLFEALRPYVTVYPYGGGGGVNPNTAPPHVLALIFFDDGGGLRLVSEDIVRRILEVREQGGLVCDRHELEDCTPMSEILETTNPVYPPLTFTSDVFTVVAEAKVGEVQRGVETVIDRSDPLNPQLLSWRVR